MYFKKSIFELETRWTLNCNNSAKTKKKKILNRLNETPLTDLSRLGLFRHHACLCGGFYRKNKSSLTIITNCTRCTTSITTRILCQIISKHLYTDFQELFTLCFERYKYGFLFEITSVLNSRWVVCVLKKKIHFVVFYQLMNGYFFFVTRTQ